MTHPTFWPAVPLHPLALQATTASPKATVVITICSSWADRRRPWYFCKNGSKREGLGVRNVRQRGWGRRAGTLHMRATGRRSLRPLCLTLSRPPASVPSASRRQARASAKAAFMTRVSAGGGGAEGRRRGQSQRDLERSLMCLLVCSAEEWRIGSGGRHLCEGGRERSRRVPRHFPAAPSSLHPYPDGPVQPACEDPGEGSAPGGPRLPCTTVPPALPSALALTCSCLMLHEDAHTARSGLHPGGVLHRRRPVDER